MLKHQAAAAAAAKAAKAAKAGKVAKTQTAFQTAANAAANQTAHYFFSMHDSTPTPAPAPTPTPTSTPTPTPTPALTSTPTPTPTMFLIPLKAKPMWLQVFVFAHRLLQKFKKQTGFLGKCVPANVYLPKKKVLQNTTKTYKTTRILIQM